MPSHSVHTHDPKELHRLQRDDPSLKLVIKAMETNQTLGLSTLRQKRMRIESALAECAFDVH